MTRINRLWLWLTILAATAQVLASSPNRIDSNAPTLRRNSRQTRHLFDLSEHNLSRRQSQEQQNDIVALGSTDPLTAAQTADNLPDVAGNADGGTITTGNLLQGDGYYNFQWNNNVFFNPSAATTGADETGWIQLPEIPEFFLNRTLSIYNRYGNESGIMPFYETRPADTSSVLRAIVVLPGKPRDTWKYANLMLNARSVAVANFNQNGVTNDSFLIVAPAMMNQDDLVAGAAHPNELVFHGSSWQRGSNSRNPFMEHPLSSYDAVDGIIDTLFDKTTYPNLNQVVVAGHSMGGQFSQRYALLKKTKRYDDNIRFWIGNPGSWAWLHDSRPYMGANASCLPNDEWDTWPYGIGGNLTRIATYARRDVIASKVDVVNRFIKRKVSYALALLDVGVGDTHCQARWQGGNHLDRGSQFALQYANASAFDLDGSFPTAHTLDYVANVSHQDYAMYSTNTSLQRIFYDDLTVRYPDLSNTTNPGDAGNVTKVRGVKAFATPAHEKLAIGLLAGSLGMLFIIFTALPVIFTADHVKDIDTKWDASSYASQESRRMLVDRKW